MEARMREPGKICISARPWTPATPAERDPRSSILPGGWTLPACLIEITSMPSRKRRKPSQATKSLPKLPPAPKACRRYLTAWERWVGAAENFNGLDDRLTSKIELCYISVTTSGYQIRINRGGRRVFNRRVLRHSEESLLEAMRLRDEASRQWPNTVRTNKIPARVLRALGLTSPVIGITRFPERSVYRVRYDDGEGKGRKRVRHFYFRVVTEEVAYAAAIDFLQSRLPQQESASSR